MTDKLIQQILPYYETDFITVPLWEEGDNRLCVNFWQILKKEQYMPNTDGLEQLCAHEDFETTMEIRTLRAGDGTVHYRFSVMGKVKMNPELAKLLKHAVYIITELKKLEKPLNLKPKICKK
jgi:hypothetical protein